MRSVKWGGETGREKKNRMIFHHPVISYTFQWTLLLDPWMTSVRNFPRMSSDRWHNETTFSSSNKLKFLLSSCDFSAYTFPMLLHLSNAFLTEGTNFFSYSERHWAYCNALLKPRINLFMSHDKDIQDKIRQIRRIIDRKLEHIIDGSEIPYISLPESMELTQITDIFEKINSTRRADKGYKSE